MSVHAEQHVIDKLKPLQRGKKLKQINIVVIRINNKGTFKNSSPCSNCIEYMNSMANRKGYIVKNIFYSDECGNIIKSSLTKLSMKEEYLTSFYRFKQRTNKSKSKSK